MSNDSDVQKGSDLPILLLAEFLENSPPNQSVRISDLSSYRFAEGSNKDLICTPEIQLHCSDDSCNGTRFFRCTTKASELFNGKLKCLYLDYRCSNCQKTEKTFSIAVVKEEENSGLALKFGELPAFGPPTPSKLIKLIGPDRESFLKGRRSENQGLGIGAFTYYRRVVENQKNRILDEIIKVAEKLDVSSDSMKELEAAKKETQFSKSLSLVKKGVPQSLLINGHNPLLLLHSALSEGLHDRSDEECLELASSVRIILIELSERLSQALKDEVELNHALKTLMESKTTKQG